MRASVPVTPIPVLATLLRDRDGPIADEDLFNRLSDALKGLMDNHPDLINLYEKPEIEARFAINHLRMRKMIVEKDGQITVAPGNQTLLDYYANTIAHHDLALAA